jgi:hypothetical protein
MPLLIITIFLFLFLVTTLVISLWTLYVDVKETSYDEEKSKEEKWTNVTLPRTKWGDNTACYPYEKIEPFKFYKYKRYKMENVLGGLANGVKHFQMSFMALTSINETSGEVTVMELDDNMEDFKQIATIIIKKDFNVKENIHMGISVKQFHPPKEVKENIISMGKLMSL